MDRLQLPVGSAPRTISVGRLTDHLGGVLLRPLDPVAGTDRMAKGVVLVEPGASDQVGVDDVVLLTSSHREELLDAVRVAAQAGAAAVVIKSSERDEDGLRELSRSLGVAVLALEPGASWLQVADLVRSVTDDGSPWGTDSGRSEDLFDLAETISALVDGPVTIEDAHSRVLAFSGRQDEADEGRIATVLGRRVPDKWLELLHQRGVFKDLESGLGPVYVTDLPGDLIPRVCVPLRAGQELIGSVWAAIEHPLSAAQEAAFREAGDVVALRLLRLRVGQDVDRQLTDDLVRRMVAGLPGAAEAASRLRLATGPLLVVGAQPGPTEGDQSGGWDVQRVRDSLAMHLGVLDARSVVAVLDGCAYAVVPVASGSAAARVVSLAGSLAERLPGRSDLVVAVGRVVVGYRELVSSRRDVDQALRVQRMLREAGRSDDRVVQYVDVQLDALLLGMADLMAEREERLWAPVAELAAYDEVHGTDLLASVAAYLDAFGNVKDAAQALQTHPNTLRYRLRRAREVCGLELSSADERLHAMIALRLRTLLPG